MPYTAWRKLQPFYTQENLSEYVSCRLSFSQPHQNMTNNQQSIRRVAGCLLVKSFKTNMLPHTKKYMVLQNPILRNKDVCKSPFRKTVKDVLLGGSRRLNKQVENGDDHGYYNPYGLLTYLLSPPDPPSSPRHPACFLDLLSCSLFFTPFAFGSSYLPPYPLPCLFPVPAGLWSAIAFTSIRYSEPRLLEPRRVS